MNTRSRLTRLEQQVQAHPVLTCYTPEATRRAEIARQRLPDCTDPQEALRLIDGQPYEVYCSLLRLVSDSVLIQMHEFYFRQTFDRVVSERRYTWQQLRQMPEADLLELHRATLTDGRQKHQRRR